MSKYDDEDDDLITSPSRRRNVRSPIKKGSDEEEEGVTRRCYNRKRISDDEEDEDLATWRKGRTKIPLTDDSEEEKTLSPTRGRGSREKSSPVSGNLDDNVGSSRRRRYNLSDDEDDKPISPLSPSRVNGATSLTNGTKTSGSSLVNEKVTQEEDEGKTKQRKDSIKNLVSKEQEQLYSVAQNRRRRRRTGDAKSTRQTAQNNGSAV